MTMAEDVDLLSKLDNMEQKSTQFSEVANELDVSVKEKFEEKNLWMFSIRN